MNMDSKEEQIPHWNKLSRLECLLAEAEVKVEQTTEKETEAKTEEETALQVRVERAAIRTRIKSQADIKFMEKGMINP